MKKWGVLVLCILGICISWSVFHLKYKQGTPLQPTKSLKEYPTYFFSVPILELSSTGVPYLIIQIEGKKIKVELDLGFRGEATFSKEVIQNIKGKTFVGQRTMYGARGKSYQKKEYKAPKIHIGNLAMRNCLMQEDVDEFLLDSYLATNSSLPHTEASGRIGWEIFKNCNLFLDLPNSQIAFCDSAQTLETHGYPIKEFAKTPLHTERGFIEMLVENPQGSSEIWVFDTGTTWNVINANDNSLSIEEMISEPQNKITRAFNIGNIIFDSVVFYKIPVPLPIHVDAILGMDFLKNHQVFIDFTHRQIYISHE
ncbi:MAG: hypothetical protein KGR16_00055 [Verrucomicrobia bacterium]|nr:hypothetical protein [Verrucomicrobiota bacterium]